MVLWGCPNTTFGLATNDREVESLALEAFGTWIADTRLEADFVWKMDYDNGSYRLTPPSNYQAVDSEFELPAGVYPDIETALLNVEFQAVAVLVGRRESPLQMHGALLSKESRGLALVGAKECGKSTLSTYLWTRGWQLLSDDGLLFEDEMTVHPVPRRVRLREGAHQLLPGPYSGELPEHQQFQRRNDGTVLFQPVLGDRRVALKHLVLLSKEEGDLEPIHSAGATLEFLIHTNSYRIHGINETLATLSRLLEGVSCYKLGRAPLEIQYERLSQL